MAVEANFSENKLSQQYSADLIHAHFEIEKKTKKKLTDSSC